MLVASAHRLKLGRGNVLSLSLVVRERFDGLLAVVRSIFLAMISFLASAGCAATDVDHLVEFALDLGLEIGLDLIDVGELGERPAAVRSEIVHARHPVGFHRRLLFLGVLPPVALDLDDQVQEVVVAVAIVDQDDEVGPVLRVSEP